jgi:hypothetical protein
MHSLEMNETGCLVGKPECRQVLTQNPDDFLSLVFMCSPSMQTGIQQDLVVFRRKSLQKLDVRSQFRMFLSIPGSFRSQARLDSGDALHKRATMKVDTTHVQGVWKTDTQEIRRLFGSSQAVLKLNEACRICWTIDKSCPC